ncbi:helix-turn-helix transcriptional regulator [Pseudomonas oryzae]|uniref:PAS domain S-box-containing protein n=1 Tax=Pseudomonas oryzae TaxID=1392877 RepID=A0A1H1S0U8_9PSED|nr:PAS domain S-box protein [Pseudomonas oryzae]SDS41575.1 PAS domain S-box-containing protein [Pseudomonas oryzae]
MTGTLDLNELKRPNLQKDISRLADLLLDAVFIVDLNGRITYASAACASIFGYTPEEMVGNAMIDFVIPEDREKTMAEARIVTTGWQRIGFENRYRHKDGRVVHVMWSARLLESEQVRIGVARDVTDLKQARMLNQGLLLSSTPLAPHELKVLELLLTDATEKQIAQRLGLAVSTTHSYVTNIFRKFGVRSRAGLMSLWLSHTVA